MKGRFVAAMAVQARLAALAFALAIACGLCVSPAATAFAADQPNSPSTNLRIGESTARAPGMGML